MTVLPPINPYMGVIPNAATMNEDEFADAVYPWMAYLNSSTLPEIEAHRVALTALSGEIEAAATAVDEANTIVLAARDEVVNTAALLPDGTINDATTSLTDTWSSNKINSELSTKADTSSVLTLAQAQATALCF